MNALLAKRKVKNIMLWSLLKGFFVQFFRFLAKKGNNPL